MSSAGRAANSNGCVSKPKERATGLIGFAAQIRRSSLIGSCAMETAEHREPCESRGSRTDLGAPGGEIPPGDSTIHCTIELPSHFDAVALERLIRHCWAKVEWGHGRILVRDGANAGWISYMLKDRQKSEFDGFLDCIIIESLHNPIADA